MDLKSTNWLACLTSAIAIIFGLCFLPLQARADDPRLMYFSGVQDPHTTMWAAATALVLTEEVSGWPNCRPLAPIPTLIYLDTSSPTILYEWRGVGKCDDPRPNVGYFSLAGGAYFMCPPGQAQVGNTCGPNPGKNKGDCPECEGNPINPLVGNKYQKEIDYVGNGAFPLVAGRVYNSSGAGLGIAMGFYSEVVPPNQNTWTTFNAPSGFGQGTASAPTSSAAAINVKIDTSWRLSYDRALTTQSASTLTATLFRPDSKTRTFTSINGAWVPDPGEMMTSLTQQVDGSGKLLGFTYLNERDETERYDASGKLLSISNRAGLTQTLQYVISPDSTTSLLNTVSDGFGHVLSFTYDSTNRLVGMTDPNGGNYVYGYDGAGNLSSVTYPGGGIRKYVYESATLPTALTGIIDEDGNRFATWSYDSFGNPVTSEHAVGVEKVTLSYPSTTNAVATDAGGASRSYSSQFVNQIAKASSVVETCGVNCSRTRSMTYDANGNIASRIDYNGNQTTYQYDLTRDLETSRTEAAGTAQARTITTQWHPTFRLPTQITESGRTTTFTYDNAGNLLTKAITAGSNTRTWTYTYNSNGQILTITGPRTDVVEVTTYAYDTAGNLINITNAVGQVTTLSNYDGNGHVGLITAPNGSTTALSYAPRGWLTNKIVTTGNIVQSTTYAYDNAGQLTAVTLPDSSSVSYTYDAAHRLTKITDSLGNSINYALDLMDNRTSETVNDPNGVLTRQVSRIFDAVNRLQQVTGAAQ